MAAQAEAVVKSQPGGSLLHLRSGFAFPARLGTLERTGEHVFGPDDVSARYGTSSQTEPWLDLYVYRADAPLENEAGEVGQIIVNNYSATPLPPMRPLPASATDGRTRWYSGEIQGQQIVTGFVIVRRGGWSIKARATSPAAAGTAAIERLLDAIEAAPWGWSPSQQAPGAGKVAALR